MGLHAGYVDRRPRSADDLFDEFICFGLELPALELAGDNEHGLVVKVVVNGNLSPRLNGKESQAVFRVTVAVIAMLGQSADARADNIVHLAPVREFVNFFFFAVFPVYNFHG